MKIMVFGEILWDVFPDKREIGGASFNFAAHMSKLGAEVKMLSALGKDTEGDDALEIAKTYGVDLSDVARVDEQTGKSLITLDGGKPDYELPFPVSYDRIPLPVQRRGGFRAQALYFGTLPVRDPDGVSRASLMELFREGIFGEYFFDINIRKQYYTEDFVKFALKRATILKLSRDEQEVVAKAAGIDVDPGEHERYCRAVAKKYPNLKIVLLTLDKDGAMAYSAVKNEAVSVQNPDVPVVSTVGCGDSMSACFLYNYLCGEPIGVCLERASVLSNFVVTRLGAIPDYEPGLLEKIRSDRS